MVGYSIPWWEVKSDYVWHHCPTPVSGQCHHHVIILKGPFSGKEILSYKKCMGCFKSCYWCSSSIWVNPCEVHGVSEDVKLLLKSSCCCLLASVTIPGLQHVDKKAGHDRPVDPRNILHYPMQVHFGCPSNRKYGAATACSSQMWVSFSLAWNPCETLGIPRPM